MSSEKDTAVPNERWARLVMSSVVADFNVASKVLLCKRNWAQQNNVTAHFVLLVMTTDGRWPVVFYSWPFPGFLLPGESDQTNHSVT